MIRGLKKNSVGTNIKQLRIFVRDRTRRKIINAIDLSDFKIPEEEADTIYLNTSDIRNLCPLNLAAHQEWERFGDRFVLGCLTGFRFSDFNRIKTDDIRNGVLYTKQNKSDKWFVTLLRTEANNILVKQTPKKVPKPLMLNSIFYIKKLDNLQVLIHLLK